MSAFFAPRDLVPVAVGSKAPHPPSLWGHYCHPGVQGCSLLPRLFPFTWHQGSLARGDNAVALLEQLDRALGARAVPCAG